MGIETSCNTGSVAIIRDEHVLGEILFDSGMTLSRNLITCIDNLITLVDIEKSEIEAISVSIGPGSYTSLRIGITAAKTIAYALNIPIVGIPTLEVTAFNLNMCPFNICVIMDAKKNELFAATFKSDGNKVYRLTEDYVTSAENLCEKITEKTVMVGNGINLYKSIFEYKIKGLVLFAREYLNIPRASSCALIGIRKLCINGMVGESDISPLYLRKVDAELLN